MGKMPETRPLPLLQKLEKETDGILRTIRELVEIESPTKDTHAVHEFIAVDWIVRRMAIIVGLLPTLD